MKKSITVLALLVSSYIIGLNLVSCTKTPRDNPVAAAPIAFTNVTICKPDADASAGQVSPSALGHTNLPPGYTWAQNEEGKFAAKNQSGALLFSYVSDSHQVIIDKAWNSYNLTPEEHNWRDVPEEINPKATVTPPVTVQGLESFMPKFGVVRTTNGFAIVLMPPTMTNWLPSDLNVGNRQLATQAVVNLMRTIEQKYDAARREMEWSLSGYPPVVAQAQTNK